MTSADTLKSWLAEHEPQMISLLEKLVNTDSGSYDKAGVDAVADVLREFFQEQGIATETIPIETHGDALRATVPAPGRIIRWYVLPSTICAPSAS